MSDAAWTYRAGSAQAGFERLTRVALALTIFCGGFVFIEPAPYEVAFALLCCVVLVRGLRLPTILMLPIVLLSLWVTGGLAAVAANGLGTKATVYVIISAYLALTTIVFAALCAERPEAMFRTIRGAYIVAALVTSIAGIMGYFSLGPGSEQFALYGRARGMFKDPNVFGPFLVLPALLMFQDCLTGSHRKLVLSSALLALFLGAILLSFSRAAWGHTAVSMLLMTALLFLTTRRNWLRIRIIAAGIIGACLGGAFISALLTVPAIYEIAEVRLSLFQDYDSGASGRFGSQIRSIPMLIEHPLGFGPYEYGKIFTQDVHNVYINGFASYGWLGGLTYLCLVLLTLLVGLRGALMSAPWQPALIAVFSTYVGIVLIGMVIDTDHWRHYFLLVGLVWGLSAASFAYRANASRAVHSRV